jgi:hypothetical protein
MQYYAWDGQPPHHPGITVVSDSDGECETGSTTTTTTTTAAAARG